MLIDSANNPGDVFENHFSLRCPHCGDKANVSAVSIPRFEYLSRFRPNKVGIAYRCDACNEPIFLKFGVSKYDVPNNKIILFNEFNEVERPSEDFEFKYLPDKVQRDFREALICYSNSCFNAFGAMCRRCIQSAADELGAKGKDKVLRQVKDMKELASLDDETFEALEQIVISGHDGAHPHLPELTNERAVVLLELIKDVLYQLFVRSAKIQEAAELRKNAISGQTSGTSK